MVAAGGVLRPGAAAEFAGPDDERFVEHAALLEVADQAGDRLVGGPAQRTVRADVAVGVPGAVAAAGVANLDEADALLGKPAGEQQLPAEIVGRFSPMPYSSCTCFGSLEKSTTCGAANCMRAANS